LKPLTSGLQPSRKLGTKSILEKGQIINKCISSGCSSTDYDKLNEIESQISDTRKQAIEDVNEAANEVSKSYLDLILGTIKKIIPRK
jgi:hypothetical protein